MALEESNTGSASKELNPGGGGIFDGLIALDSSNGFHLEKLSSTDDQAFEFVAEGSRDEAVQLDGQILGSLPQIASMGTRESTIDDDRLDIIEVFGEMQLESWIVEFFDICLGKLQG